MTPACMGGWCEQRERCAAYHQQDRREVMERQCLKGEEVPVTFRAPKPAEATEAA